MTVQDKNPDLKIHPRLARFLKKWGFTRESEDYSVFERRKIFTALYNGRDFIAVFHNGSFWGLFGGGSYIIDSFCALSIPNMERFIREHS